MVARYARMVGNVTIFMFIVSVLAVFLSALCRESGLARVAITNAVPQAIDRLPQETRQSLRAIPACSEMGSDSTCEIL
jgi:hypothetical protein